MYPLLETIRFEGGEFAHPEYHLRRMEQSVKSYFGELLRFDFEMLLEKAALSMENKQGLYKFRLLYDTKYFVWEFVPYDTPTIKSLKLVYDNAIDYSFKFSNREALLRLYNQRGDADDVLIVKNDEVTDTSFANIILYDDIRWVTPKNPLLHGTQRAFLLKKGIVTEAVIRPKDMNMFREIRIINAMIRFEDAIKVSVY